MELPDGFRSTEEKTFQYEDHLPSLPVPRLKDTLDTYLDSVRPHVTEEEFRQTQTIVQQFQHGIGGHLQWKLMERAKYSRNWLEQYWLDKAYLEWRNPIAPLVNISGPMPSFSLWPPKAGTQVERTALILWFTVQYWLLIRREEIPVNRGSGNVPWCMDQFKNLYNACRIPGLHKDKINCHFKLEKEGPCPSHVIVMCRGYIFRLDTLDQNGEPLTAPELQSQLQYIRDISDHRPMGFGLGCLTTEYRATWFKLRQHMTELHPDNERHLHLIETSMLVLALDEASPPDFNMVSQQGLVGDATDRWFDKSCILISFKNGTFSVNADHTPYDGMTMLVSSFFTLLGAEKCGGKWKGSTVVRQHSRPRELVFHLDDVIHKGLQHARVNFKRMADNLEMLSTRYTGYGSGFMRQYKFHPDAYVQLAFQLTYYSIHNRPAPTYETANIRKFWRGRTETVKSCSTEAIEWSKAMLNPEVSKISRVSLLKVAALKHQQLMKNAVEFKGCDRHLLGLYVVAEEEGLPIPQLFTDPSFVKSGGGGNYILSTSFTGYTRAHGGVAPMCPHGYGAFYSIQDDTVTVFITAWNDDDDTSVEVFYDNLQKTFRDMKDLLQTADISKSKI